MNDTIFFNAHHSPMGAFATFTFGCKGRKGGLGLELSGPANENLFIGIEDVEAPGHYHALPFFDEESLYSNLEQMDVEGVSDFYLPKAVRTFEDQEVRRHFGPAIDTWKAGDLTFRVFSPIRAVPDPDGTNSAELMESLLPAILAELTVDNRLGTRQRKAFFGYGGSDRTTNMRGWREGDLVCLGQGLQIAIGSTDPAIYCGIAHQPEAILLADYQERLNFMLGSMGLLVGEVQAGEMRTFQFAIGFHRGGVITSGLETSYLYNRWFSSIEGVLKTALDCAPVTIQLSERQDMNLRKSLSPDRAFMLSHALRSYCGSTQCLAQIDGKPLWVVNEGEYRMMNTFDLTVDHAFLELALNPWTVRNVLDLFVERYSYVDRVRFPGEASTHPGGITFTHDMGVANGFSPAGHSCYEQPGRRGVLSFMSGEELVNWVLCACLYYSQSKDQTWLESMAPVFRDTLQSLANRDHPDPEMRNGVMSLDSSRCEGGAEITTYDSLDRSLGQARNNVYLGLKTWAAYLMLSAIFATLDDQHSFQQSKEQAGRAALTITQSADETGLLPSVLGEGVNARIIPVIEGLAYPYLAGLQLEVSEDGPYGPLVGTLKRHVQLVLKNDVCVFPDGGWKLSSTSNNSWLSKIYLCQFVSEQILKIPTDGQADRAHRNWLLHEESRYFAWSDQILSGIAKGSKYYPRGITGALWLLQDRNASLCDIRSCLVDPLGSPNTRQTIATLS